MKTKIVLGIVACILLFSSQALALDPWLYIRIPCSEADVYQRMGFPDKKHSYLVGTENQRRYSLYYQRTNHNGKEVFIIFTVVPSNRRNVVTGMDVRIMRKNPKVW